MTVYRDGRLEAEPTGADELGGGDLLHGLRLPVAAIFEEASEA